MSFPAQPKPRRFSADEYNRLPEVIGFKDELIEGERVWSPMPKFAHTIVLNRLEALLKVQFPNLHVLREAGWRIRSEDGFESVPGPDLMMVFTEDYEKAARRDGYFEGRPVFVVEVVSPTERKSRRLQKVGLYLEAGAGSVVEIDYTKQRAFLYRSEEDVAEIITERMTFPFEADLRSIVSPSV